MNSAEALHSFWFGRFQVYRASGNQLQFRDRLDRHAKRAAAERFAEMDGDELKRELFTQGFVQTAIGTVGEPVRHAAADVHDKVFWQFPCRTEGAAWDEHVALDEPVSNGNVISVYLGLPWATWIDVERKSAWGPAGASAMQHQLQMIGVRLSGLRGVLAELGVELALHTVCQHIYWRDMIPVWRSLGITDAWLSHCPADGVDSGQFGFRVHPWSLYAVNVRDEQRRAGLTEGKDPAAKPVLASFVGAHADHYLSDIRLKLLAFSNEARFVVKVTGKWHFEDVVYSHQVAGAPLAAHAHNGDSVRSYNQLLSDSVFSLCPAGAGPNTLRLWESLAVGSIPVMLGPVAAMPRGGNLPDIDWDSAVVRISEDQVSNLPAILKAIPLARVRAMQRLGMEAYSLVRGQRCFQ